jgi:hypothetical protein
MQGRGIDFSFVENLPFKDAENLLPNPPAGMQAFLNKC